MQRWGQKTAGGTVFCCNLVKHKVSVLLYAIFENVTMWAVQFGMKEDKITNNLCRMSNISNMPTHLKFNKVQEF